MIYVDPLTKILTYEKKSAKIKLPKQTVKGSYCMKILVLNGSPRTDGNTEAMINAFKAGAETAGHTAQVLHVGKMKAAGCVACEYCHTKGGGQCAVKDDMQQVYAALAECDMLVLASPIYYFGLTGQLQSVISRFYARGKLPNIKKAAMLLSSGSPNVYDASVAEYKGICTYLGFKDMGVRTAFGPQNKSEDTLAEVRSFGETV